MSTDRSVLESTVDRLLSGKDIHAHATSAFEGLDWQRGGSRPAGAPHSIFQLVNHMAYWQEWGLKWLDGAEPPVPEHASGSWPGSERPATSADWEKAVERFRKGLDELHDRSRGPDLLSTHGEMSRLELLQAIAAHNSYHLGQVVLLRQLLAAWPPPSGGLTW